MAHSPDRPVAAQYVVTFLKPEMLHVYRQITALEAWRPVVLCEKRENEDRFPFTDVVLARKPRTHALRRIWQKQLWGRPITIYRSEARRIMAKLHALNAGLLHVFFGHIGVHLLPLLEIADVPVIVSFHGADAQVDLKKPAHRERTRRVFALATLILVRSESISRRLLEIGCPPEKIRLHRTGLPLGQIPFYQRRAPADGAWRCLQACRLIEKKGLATSVRAFAALARVHPHSTLTIAGDGPHLEQTRALAAELGIGDRVLFTGFLPQSKLGALCAEAHLFLHPSELGTDGNQEGVPNAVLEAMASGLPIFATRHGGIPEAVEDGKSGWLVDEKDSEALGAALLEIAGAPERYAAMSETAARHVAETFDLAKQTRRLESLYAEAADAPRASMNKV